MLNNYPNLKSRLKYLLMVSTHYRVRWRLPPQSNPSWSLTFDDGPLPNTVNILKALDDYQIKATFFLVGERMLAEPGIVAEIVAKGHTIGSHGLRHIFMNRLSPSELCHHVEESFEIIKSLAGDQPKIFRPPWGAISFYQLVLLLRKNIDVVYWSHQIDPGKKDIIEMVPCTNCNGPIILLHDYDDPAIIRSINHFI
jgi:peptidoglycan-N-acetylglucosamine deacetylase